MVTFSHAYAGYYPSLVAGIKSTGAAATVTNSGTINALGTWINLGTFHVGVGIELQVSGGVVTNQAGGQINAVSAVEALGVATVSNSGVLTGSAYGITFTAAGSITNTSGGTISGFFDGIRDVNAAVTVTNDGSINGPQNYAIRLGPSGLIVNTTNGRLTGGSDGVLFDGLSASLNNAGYIFGAGTYRTTIGSGAYLSNGGMVTNTGTISGKLFGVRFKRPGIVSNAGLITGATGISMAGTAGTSSTIIDSGLVTGTGGTAVLFTAGDDRLVLGQGAAFNGAVDGGAGSNTLEIANGAGTLPGFGTSIVNFASIVFDPGAAWTIAGNTAGLSGLISGFAAGDVIDLAGLNETGKSYSNGTLTLTGDASFALQLPGAFTTESFVLTPDISGGTDISLACFAAGTRLATKHGLVAVEDLRPGDVVLAREAGASPVVWIGHRRVDCRRHPRPDEVRPIRVRANAFGPGMPVKDLLLSPDHAVFADGVLIPVRHLVDGVAVVRVNVDLVTYYHVELPAHDVVLAEGLPCESYLDTNNRASFTNGGPVASLHPCFESVRREAMGCAPLVITGPVLAAVRQRLSRWAAAEKAGATA